MPFGPDISWPTGFRQLDPYSRRVLESGYDPGGYGPGGYGPGQYDPGYGTAGHRGGVSYRQPAMDDYGYGDPGYADPSYDGPRSAYGGGLASPGGYQGISMPGGSPGPDGGYGSLPGYHLPENRDSSHPAAEIYPMTGAQEALPATGPQQIVEAWAANDFGSPQIGSQAYPEQWYDNPRPDGQRAGGSRRDGSPGTDPRLEGMRYDQLHYDEEPSYGEPGYDEPLDDEAWVQELRRSAPSYPQRPTDEPGRDQRPADPQRRSGPRGPGYGEQPRYNQPPGYGQQPGYGPAGNPQRPAYEQGSGYGQVRDDLGNPGPRMSTGREASPGSWQGAGPGVSPSGPALPHDLGFQGADYLGAPTQVGVLTPPAIRQLDPSLDGGPLLASPSAGQLLAPPVRPGHGLDGPEITSSWPAQPQADDVEAFEEFWQQDDEDGGDPGLFPGDDADSGGRGGRASGRRAGRRRGRSNDHRLWLALVAVLVVAAAAIFAILKFEFPSNGGGPAHTMVTPASIGTYARTVDLERQTNVAQLRDEVIRMSSGQASHVVSAVYESGNSAAGSTEQIIMFIGGHLANAAPAQSIASFTQKFPGATIVSVGSLGGKAACVEEGAATANSVSMCAWFDNDSFGELVSPTMDAKWLASAMLTIRPAVELVAGK